MSQGQVIPSRGLDNLGNMCYINAALQCLFSSTQFTNAFISSLPKTNSPLLSAVGELLHRMRSGATCADARNLKETLGATVDRFSSFSQQDSQEFLTVLLENLHNALMATPQQPSVITEWFQGEHECVLTCQTCQKSTSRQDPFMFLFVPIDDSPAKLHVADLYEKEETFEDSSWFCSHCQTKTSVTRSMKLCKVPPILMMYFKRFSHKNGTEYKLDTDVEFPFKLQVPNCDQLYSLIAVINHHGTISGGHYFAFCKHGDRWLCFNDSSVTACQEWNVVTRDAYVLFYERVEQQEDVQVNVHDRRDGCQYQPNEQPKSEMHLPAMQRDGKDEINHQAKVSTEMKTENNTSQNKEDSNGNSDTLPIIGFHNYSNNNHLNAVLQCLKATQPLHAYLQHITDRGTCGDIMRTMKTIFSSTNKDTLKSNIESLQVCFHHSVDDPKTFLTSVLNELYQEKTISREITVCSVPIDDMNSCLMKCGIVQESREEIQSQIIVVLLHRDQWCQSTAKCPIFSATFSDGPPIYSLYGVICNNREMCYAHCKINEKWYEFSNENVEQMDMSSISDDACILFYQKDL